MYENSTIDVKGSISMRKMYNNELCKINYINNNKLQKIDEIVKEGDVVEVLNYYEWKCSNLLKCCINDNTLKCKSNK